MTMAESNAAHESMLAKQRYVGLRPGRSFLVLPAAPRKALWSGLGLYDGVEPLQRGLLRAARTLVAARLERLLPANSVEGVDWEWWDSWVQDVARPLLGPVANVAIRIPPNGRTCMLLMDAAGTPTGFVKRLAEPLAPFSAQVRDCLDRAPFGTVRIPRTLAAGHHREQEYILFEPITAGPHRRPPHDPARVSAIVDEWRERLKDIPTPPDVEDHYVVCHTGFTPRNVRVAGDGEWWLFDWDNVTWGPCLAPELRYWCADASYRWRVDPDRAARAIYARLRARASDAEIVEATTWSGTLPTYRATEQVLRATVGQLAGGALS